MAAPTGTGSLLQASRSLGGSLMKVGQCAGPFSVPVPSCPQMLLPQVKTPPWAFSAALVTLADTTAVMPERRP